MSNLNLNPISDSPPRPSAPGSTQTRLEIDATRARQTERPATPFRSVLAGGVSLLMSGAEVATHVVGGPVLAAAAAASGGPATTSVETLMQQGQASNLQLLALQQQVQQENQRFTTVSNVMRAKHDTAKAAVSNIRA